ncbi:unnamed protein product, partial [Prorocentrum cordatum]
RHWHVPRASRSGGGAVLPCSHGAAASAALVAAGAALGAGLVLLRGLRERRGRLRRNAAALPPAYAQLAADPAVRRVYMSGVGGAGVARGQGLAGDRLRPAALPRNARQLH